MWLQNNKIAQKGGRGMNDNLLEKIVKDTLVVLEHEEKTDYHKKYYLEIFIKAD
jgi:hypothetical protein